MMDNKNVETVKESNLSKDSPFKKLESLSGLINTRLEELNSEIKEKYNFLQVNRSRETALFDENGCFRKR